MDKGIRNIVLICILLVIMVILFWIGIKDIGIELYLRNKDTKYAEEIYEKNKSTVFRLSKLITYSGAEAKDNSDKLQDFNISQYSDLALYIDNHHDIKDLTEENTVKKLYIDNFKIQLTSKLGQRQNLFYKNPFNMGKYRELDFNKIDDKLEYDIIFNNKENDEEFYNTPVFYTDCSNPISLSYINDNIYTNYSVKKNSSISYDGRVLKDIDVDLDDITPTIGFTVHIVNNLDEEFICNFNCRVNLESKDGSIYSGYYVEIRENYENQYKFFKL